MEPNRLPNNYATWSMPNHPFVARVWSHRTMPGRTDIIPPVYTDGGALLFEMDTRKVLLRGPCSQPLEHRLIGTHRIGIALRSGYLAHAFGYAPEEVVDSMAPAHRFPIVVPDAAWRSEASMVEFIMGLVNQLPQKMPLLHEVEALTHTLPWQQGNFSVQTWARSANMTERTLYRHSMKYFGVAPKNFLRVARLSMAMEKLVREEYPRQDGSMISVVQSLGYTDQAHFCHDCKSLLGNAPQQALNDLGLFFAQ